MTKEEAEAELQRLTGACVRAISGGVAPPFIAVAALETHLSKMLGAVFDERDEAVRLLERWEQRWQPMVRIYVTAPLDGETAAFLARVKGRP